jgi:hypothetical protein
VIDTLDFDQKQTLLRLVVDEVHVTGWHVQIRLRIPLDDNPDNPRPPGPTPAPDQDSPDHDQVHAGGPGDGAGDRAVGAARPTAAVRDSRVNQLTRRPVSIAACASASTRCVLPVPDGPVTARLSARPIHSRVARACWVGVGMELSCSRQDANVFPAGRRRGSVGGGWRRRGRRPLRRAARAGFRRGPSVARGP